MPPATAGQRPAATFQKGSESNQRSTGFILELPFGKKNARFHPVAVQDQPRFVVEDWTVRRPDSVLPSTASHRFVGVFPGFQALAKTIHLGS